MLAHGAAVFYPLVLLGLAAALPIFLRDVERLESDTRAGGRNATVPR